MSERLSEQGQPRKAYAGPACPHCGTVLDVSLLAAGEQACPACAKPFLATPFAPPEPRVETVSTLIEAGPESAVPCARHAGNAAVANCSRCGVFMCALCRLDIDGMSLCPACFGRLTNEGALTSACTRLRDWRGISIAFGVVGCFMYVVGLITGPLTLFFAWMAFRQRRELNERGILSLLLAVLFGLMQIGFSVFLIWAIVSQSTSPST